MSEYTGPGRAPDEWALAAFAEGRLDAGSARGREIAAWLHAHPQARARVDEYARQDREIRAVFAAKFAEPVPARLQPAAIRRRQRREYLRWTGAVAGIAVTVVLVSALSTAQRTPAGSLDGFAQDVLRQIESDAPAQRDTAAQPVPMLAPAGFELAGERRMQAASGMLTEQFYRDAGGRSLRLFIGIDPRKPAIEPQWLYADGQHVVYWEVDGRRYALSGAIDRPELQQLAAQVMPMPDDGLQLAGDAAVAQTTEAARATTFEPVVLPAATQPTSTEPASTQLDVGVDPYGQIEIRSEAEQPLL